MGRKLDELSLLRVCGVRARSLSLIISSLEHYSNSLSSTHTLMFANLSLSELLVAPNSFTVHLGFDLLLVIRWRSVDGAACSSSLLHLRTG